MIQRNYRNHRAINAAKIIIRKEKEMQASVHCVKAARGFVARRRVARIRRDPAARRLQRVGRGYTGRRRFKRLRAEDDERRRREAAALKLQGAAA